MRNLARKLALGGSQKEYFSVPDERVRGDLPLSVGNVYSAFLSILRRSFKSVRYKGMGVKFQLRSKVLLEKYSFESNKQMVVDIWFPATSRSVRAPHEIEPELNKSIADMMTKFDAFVQKGSGWVVKKVQLFSMTVNKFYLFSGGNFCSSLPLKLKRSRSCISIGKECNEKCFLKCVVAALGNTGKNVGRWGKHYEELMRKFEEVCEGFLSFPVDERGIKAFQKKLPVAINVYGYCGVVYPKYLSPYLEGDRFTVNLLLHDKHYFLIRNMSALVAPQCKKNKRKCYVCPSCLSYFVREKRYEMHTRLCKKDGTQYVFPEDTSVKLRFSSFNSMVNAPFVIYADMETMITEEVMLKRGKTLSTRKHVPVSVGALTVCRDRPEFGSRPFLYTGTDCIEMLMAFFNEEVMRARNIYERVLVPCNMREKDELHFRAAQSCEMCQRKFVDYPYLTKVRDHCHISGRYRYALCSECNLTRAKRPFEVYVFFHGFSNYDSHFLIQKMSSYPKYPINVIPRNSEKYLAFSLGSLKFKDSYQFLQCSLSTLVENLSKKGEENFKNLKKFVPEKDMRDLLMRKGVFPYSFFSSLSILDHKELPPKQFFKNDLDGKEISTDDYAHALRVWHNFECQTFRDYLHVYLLCDVLHLSDVFESFRDNCVNDFCLDPAHYLSSPHFTYDAFLRYSNAKLDLLTDINQYFFLEKGIRGGLSMVAKRYSKANNPSISGYDSSRSPVYILDLDSNNLYGKAMQDFLPFGGFRWMNQSELTKDYIMNLSPTGEEGCFVECTLDYPAALHDLHADYPLAPVKTKITYDKLSPYARFLCDQHKLKSSLKTLKLLTTFERRSFYVLHYRNFQLYLRLGMQLVAIHSGLAFKQAPFMRDYVVLNSEKRAQTTNRFDSDFYKLLVNSLFGKTIENPEKRSKIRLCRTQKELEKSVGHFSFKRSKIINKGLVGVEMKNTMVKMNKPFYVGNAVLELSKFHMYNFHYNVMKEVFQERIELLYTDTDSLLYEIRSLDPYAELREKNVINWFDFSNFPPEHPMFSDKNKRVPGLFKDECNVKVIREFVGLRSKMYSIRIEGEEGKEVKVAKGVKKSVIENDLKFSNYLDCLVEEQSLEHSFKCIRSSKHSVHTMSLRKKTLCGFDDKRYLVDMIFSLPYGYKGLGKKTC